LLLVTKPLQKHNTNVSLPGAVKLLETTFSDNIFGCSLSMRRTDRRPFFPTFHLARDCVARY